MRVTEKLTPVAAAMSALATLACCLPLGIAGAVGALGLSVALETVAAVADWSRGDSAWRELLSKCTGAERAANGVAV